MPAARNDVDWSAIAAQAAAGATHKEIAEHWDLPLGTVKARCTREGWKATARAIQAQKTGTVEVIPQTGSLHPRASQKGVSLLGTLGERSKLRAAKVGDRTLAAINRKKEDALIAQSQAFKQTVDALDKVHQWSGNTQSLTQVNINLTNGKLPDRSK